MVNAWSYIPNSVGLLILYYMFQIRCFNLRDSYFNGMLKSSRSIEKLHNKIIKNG